MLRSASCRLSQLRQLVTIRLILKSLTLTGSHTPCKTLESKSCSMSQELKTECLTQRRGQCFLLDGKLKSNLNTKKTHYSQRNASKQCLTKVESWGLEHSDRSLAAMLLLGNKKSRRGAARLGEARRGKARRGRAWLGVAGLGKHTASFRRCGSLLGAAWPGTAGRGEARRGLANTPHLFGDAAVCSAWRGTAGRGSAGHGEAWLGEAWQTHGILRGVAVC